MPDEGRAVLEAAVRRWSRIPWDQIVGLLQDSQPYQVTFETRKYQVDVELLENTDAHIGLSVTVNDGASSQSTPPLSQIVIVSKTTRHERRRIAR
jgi:hypothetical protein